jgi:hypothetical protein
MTAELGRRPKFAWIKNSSQNGTFQFASQSADKQKSAGFIAAFGA